MTSHWRSHLIALGGAIAAILCLFVGDVTDIVSIWWTSSTFTHCLFILPLVGWLIWQRRSEVALLTPRIWAPGIALVGAAGFGWIVGEAAGVSLIRHVSIVLMIDRKSVV